MDIQQAKKIMGKNFIGLEELDKISFKLGIINSTKIKKTIPKIKFTEKKLKKLSKDYILILGTPMAKDGKALTLNKMRSYFGWDPKKLEPCFYNQDWYLKEKFADKTTLKFKWYLVAKKVVKSTRGQDPKMLEAKLNKNKKMPSTILTAYTFFAYYFLNNKHTLWKYDFIWCSDKDKNGDRIYVGRYNDPKKINKNGFNIHRHLSIRPCYGMVEEII